MPKKGTYDTTYSNQLKEIGITLLDSFCGAKKHHLLKCDNCSNEWKATPLSKLQNHKKFGYNGCPECNKKRRTEPKKKAMLQMLHERFIVINLNGYDGRQHYPVTKITVQNPNCKHIFTSDPRNLIRRNVICPVCNKERKSEYLTELNETRHEEWKKTADEWDIYRLKVRNLSETIYEENKHILNPDDLPRGRAGQDGAYHLDHIAAIRLCFEKGVPAELCASLDNLQLMDWRQNIQHKKKVKDGIPDYIAPYILL